MSQPHPRNSQSRCGCCFFGLTSIHGCLQVACRPCVTHTRPKLRATGPTLGCPVSPHSPPASQRGRVWLFSLHKGWGAAGGGYLQSPCAETTQRGKVTSHEDRCHREWRWTLSSRLNHWPCVAEKAKGHPMIRARSPAHESPSLFRTPRASMWVPLVRSRGVPGVPECLPVRWQASRSDLQGRRHRTKNITITQNICVD